MHTFEHKLGRIHHDNFDLAGNLIIQNAKGQEVEVSGELVLAFLVEYIRNKVLADIEQMSEDGLIRVIAYLGQATPGEASRSST